MDLRRSTASRTLDQFGALTDRTFAILRFGLALGSLIVIYFDPTQPDRYIHATYYTLSAYALYSFAVYLIVRRRTNFEWTGLQFVVWVDMIWYSALIALSTGTNNLFSFFYLFVIIVASSRGGFRLGISVTVTSMVLLVLVDLSLNDRTAFEMSRFILRRIAMLTLGSMLAYWGGAELALKKRLGLLKELSLTANPRFGADHTIELMLRRLLDLYGAADYAIFILKTDSRPEIFRVTRSVPEGQCAVIRIEGQKVLPGSLDDAYSAVFSKRRFGASNRPVFRRYPLDLGAASRHEGEAQALAETLGARSFVTAPSKFRERLRGRLLVASTQSHAFHIRDASFLEQVGSQVLPVIENIRLVDRMASEASEEERRRIARTVHDRVIQPYFGLQIGLKALREMLNGRNEKGNNEKAGILLDQLTSMTAEGIEELRQYVYGLKHSSERDDRLIDAIRRFADKFESATGIQVLVDGVSERLSANDRLSAEVFQMTAEALSNVHRHTHARNAHVRLDVDGERLVLRVENETSEDLAVRTFSPASISERAEAIGGRSEVLTPEGRTVVRVEVPL